MDPQPTMLHEGQVLAAKRGITNIDWRQGDSTGLAEMGLDDLALAMMGVTALIKKRWLFWMALIPAAIGVAMGVAGFCGADTSHPAIKWATDFLS